MLRVIEWYVPCIQHTAMYYIQFLCNVVAHDEFQNYLTVFQEFINACFAGVSAY